MPLASADLAPDPDALRAAVRRAIIRSRSAALGRSRGADPETHNRFRAARTGAPVHSQINLSRPVPAITL